MGYNKFIQQLSRGIENKIVAYDNKEGQNGCLIYLRSGDHTIFVPDEIIEYRLDDVIQMVRDKISTDTLEAPFLILRDTGDHLMFEAKCPGHKPDAQGSVPAD